MKHKNLMALILTAVLTTTLLSGCGTQDGDSSAQGQTSAPVSQLSQPVSKEDSQTSQVDELSSLLALTPEKEDMYRMLGQRLAKSYQARENGNGTIYLEGDHIRIYQEEIDYLTVIENSTAEEKGVDPAEWAVRQMKIQEAFCFAAEQENLEFDRELLNQSIETAKKQFVDPNDLFYPGNMLTIEGSGLSKEEFLDGYMDWARRNYIAQEYADSKFSQWYETWEKTEALQVESWTDGINSTLNVAWEKEQLRMAEEILEKDHAEVKA
ncbi:MAG: hypothetical protein ACOX60_09710 [Massiliimalia sp.]